MSQENKSDLFHVSNNPPFDTLGLFTFLRTYARRHNENDTNSTVETWQECLQRVVKACNEQLHVGFTEQEQKEVFDLMYNLKCVVGGRFLWQLGTRTVDKLGIPSLQNCACIVVDDPVYPFTWAMNLLMLGCVPPNTEVLTENGLKEIRHIEVGERVWSYNVTTNRNELQRVSKIHNPIVPREMNVKLIGMNGHLITSKKHPVLVLQQGTWQYCLAGQIQPGDTLRYFPDKMDRVIAIEDNLDISPEWKDITVENNHNYFCGQGSYYCTHNCGIGFRILPDDVEKLPVVKHAANTRKDGNDADFIVPDSREGWVKLLSKILKSHFYSGRSFTYSCHVLRSQGAPIKGFGGLASGPEVLCEGMVKIDTILNRRAGQKIRPVDALDIMTTIGWVVVSGNVRRCLPAGVLVHTQDGLIPIERVQPGQHVLTRQGYFPVRQVFQQGHQKLVRIITQSGLFRCTANHRMAVQGGQGVKWIEAGKLQRGDKLIPARSAIKGRATTLPMLEGQLAPELTENMAWLLGVIQATGLIDGAQLRLHFSNLSGHLASRAAEELQLFGRPVTVDNTGHLIVVSAQLGAYFAQFQGEHIHPCILQGTVPIRQAYIQGIRDRLGNKMMRRRYYVLETASEKFAQHIQTLLYSLGMESKFGPFGRSPDARWTVILTETAGSISHEVVSIVDDVYAETYDLEVETNHEFFCQGYLTHNSALLALGDHKDREYLRAKRWDLGNIPNERAYSNNSIVCNDINEILDDDEFWQGYNGNGEPYGLINLKLSQSCGRLGETQYPDHGVVGYNPCITGDSMILTSEGLKAVTELVGKPFRAIINGKEYPSTEKGFWCTGIRPVYRITLRNGMSIKATGNHKFYRSAEKMTWVPVEMLSVGDKLIICNTTGHHSVDTYSAIATIDCLSPESVYDCTIETVHCFSANGILTHNCAEQSLHNGETCVTGETLIHTRQGLYPISELVGKEVEIYNGQEWSKVIPFKARDEDDFMRITFSDGSELDVTPYHEFSVATQTAKKSFVKMRADKLTTGLLLPKFDLPVEENGVICPWAYTLGVFTGDGYIDRDNAKICANEDCHETIFAHCLLAGKPNKMWKDESRVKTMYRVSVNMGPFDFWQSLRSHNDGLPSYIREYSKSSLLEFFAGWIDTDGSIRNKDSPAEGFIITSTAILKLRQAQILLRRCGINHATIYKMASAGAKTNYGKRNYDLWVLQIPSFECGSIPTKLKRLNNIGNRYRINPAHPLGKKIDTASRQYITSIQHLTGKQPSYCFSEPKRHMGVFGNVLTHQCCLSELYLPNMSSKDELFRAAKYMYRICKHSLTLPCADNKVTEDIVHRNMRMGIGVTGYLQATDEQRSWLPECYEYIRQVDRDYSSLHGLPTSIKLTTVKPSGCVTGESLILTNRGLMRMDEIGDIHGKKWQPVKGISIINSDGKNYPVTKFFVNGNVPTKKIVTADGFKMEVSLQHRLQVCQDGEIIWKEAMFLKPGDKLRCIFGHHPEDGNDDHPEYRFWSRKKLIDTGIMDRLILRTTSTPGEHFDPIVEITDSRNDTYDIEVDDVHQYLLNGVVSHNTLSLLGHCTPGVHPGFARYYKRRVRISSASSLIPLAKRHGYPVEYVKKHDGTIDYTTQIVTFPYRLPDNTVLAENCTAVDQLEWVKKAQTEWSDNSVSVTVYYRKHEIPAIKEWLRKNYNNSVKTVSFLLHSDHGFAQAPLEQITKEEYEALDAQCQPIQSVEGVCYVNEETLIGQNECAGGACPLR